MPHGSPSNDFGSRKISILFGTFLQKNQDGSCNQPDNRLKYLIFLLKLINLRFHQEFTQWQLQNYSYKAP